MLGILRKTLILLLALAEASGAHAAETNWDDVSDGTLLRDALGTLAPRKADRTLRFSILANAVGICREREGYLIDASFMNGVGHKGVSAAHNTREYACALRTSRFVYARDARYVFEVKTFTWRATGESLAATENPKPRARPSRYGAGLASFEPHDMTQDNIPICDVSLEDVSGVYSLSCRVNCDATVGDLRSIFGPDNTFVVQSRSGNEAGEPATAEGEAPTAKPVVFETANRTSASPRLKTPAKENPSTPRCEGASADCGPREVSFGLPSDDPALSAQPPALPPAAFK